MPTTEQEVSCPKCGGKTWDNRLTKRNPKQPDFKCRDRACDGVIWPPRPGEAPAAPVPTKTPASVRQGYSSGGPLPGEVEAGFVDGTPALPHEKMEHLFRVYDICLSHAHASAKKAFGNDVTDEAVASMCATLFIQATKAGV